MPIILGKNLFVKILKLIFYLFSSGYDSHLLVSSLSKFMDRIRFISAIPLNTEKFKTLRINNIELKDSMALLDGSLEKLIETLKRSNHAFPLMQKIFPRESQRELLKMKSFFPYEFCHSIKQLEKQNTLPERKEFFSKLSMQTISEENYEHAQKVWKAFNCKNMIDYTKIYVKSDCILLAEVIQTFRKKIYDEFKLDAVHFISLPSLAKEIMLKVQVIDNLIFDLINICLPGFGLCIRSY